MSTTTTLFGSTEAQAARDLIGGTAIGELRNELLKQILVATANKAGGSSSVAFADITGAPGDNAALAAALAAKLDLAGGTMTGALVNSTNGAASTPSLSLTGTVFTGGSSTTTKPSLLVEPAGTTSTAWQTSGTLFGANAPTGFTGDLFNGQVNGDSRLRINYLGSLIGGGAAFGNFDITVPPGSGRSVQINADGAGLVSMGGAAVQSFAQVRQRGTTGFATARNSVFQFDTSDNDVLGTAGAVLCSGSGSPEGAKTAPPGSLYLNQAGGPPYYKDSGTGNTGWVAMT